MHLFLKKLKLIRYTLALILQKNCKCRKPKPGMLIKAAELNNINLKKLHDWR